MPFDIAGARYLGQIAWKRWTTGLLPQGIRARRSAGMGMSGLPVTPGNQRPSRPCQC